MNIQTIQVTKFPLVIFTDSHTNIKNIRKLRELYPNNDMICLGDITFLFAKPKETFNQTSIDFFMTFKIPCLMGNHEEHIINCAKADNGDSLITFKSMPQFFEEGSLYDVYGLSHYHLNYLQSLPRGFKLVLPDGNHYLCFHNRPKDLWSHTERGSLTREQFLETYPVTGKTKAVIMGHQHMNYVKNYGDVDLIAVGQLCGSNHHTGENNGNNYALLTENGIEFKKLP